MYVTYYIVCVVHRLLIPSFGCVRLKARATHSKRSIAQEHTGTRHRYVGSVGLSAGPLEGCLADPNSSFPVQSPGGGAAKSLGGGTGRSERYKGSNEVLKYGKNWILNVKCLEIHTGMLGESTFDHADVTKEPEGRDRESDGLGHWRYRGTRSRATRRQ